MQIELAHRWIWKIRSELTNAILDCTEVFSIHDRRRASVGYQTPADCYLALAQQLTSAESEPAGLETKLQPRSELSLTPAKANTYIFGHTTGNYPAPDAMTSR